MQSFDNYIKQIIITRTLTSVTNYARQKFIDKQAIMVVIRKSSIPTLQITLK